ncbi:hypothetical protein [Actinacidiphila rubida]|uniref:Uncharacterized protein n=1 Tax=Actinacidiphila rubida TaxID=310780 RepID=A0A1H8V6C3_9ACTN|nr:hypothetical protein [Actinacidiphila rubida]SEP10308.1 hypothetical protein SAMN05216267_11062 [Actinacidiphila rubida]
MTWGSWRGAVTGAVAGLLVWAAVPAVAAGPPSQAESLAAALRADPVYVSDQLPREVPRSTAPEFAAAARRTGVPTYVMVLPDQHQGSLLGTVHDRLGRNGLYVLLDTTGVVDARAFGVAAPATDAHEIALYSLPYDAGALRSFQVFADAVASGAGPAARRAARLQDEYGDSGKGVEPFYLDRTDRQNQGFVTGILLTSLPSGTLLVALYVRRRRGRRWVRPPEAVVAAVLAGAVLAAAPLVCDQKLDGPEQAPTQADLGARLDRVAAGLRHAAVYSDPESPQVLDAAGLAELDRRIAAYTPGPVKVAVVPQLSDDESAGDQQVFASGLHRLLGGKGIYVVADPLEGAIHVYDFGIPVDAAMLTLDLPDALAYDHDTAPAVDHRMGQRLDDLMAYMAKVPHSEPAPDGPDDRPDPVAGHRLPPLFHGDFWPGLFVGALLAGLLLGVTAAVTGTAAALARRRRRAAKPHVTAAPAHPSAAWLARTAGHEVNALAAELAAADANAPGRERAWECLDAAMLLSGGAQARSTDGAADLAAATVLARAGRAALAGHAYRTCCSVNPLHGRSVNGTRYCVDCRPGAGSAALDALRLTLPGPRRSGRVPYEKAPGPLPAVRDGVARLVASAKEYASVR